jgi:transposase-like protein
MSYNNTEKYLSKVLESDMDRILEKVKKDGATLILQTVLNTLMKSERAGFLSNSKDDNKANGYYPRMAQVLTDYFKIQVPRDRLGSFRPIFLDMINDEKRKLDELAFKLYTAGLSTRDISRIIQDTFGGKYSSSQISVITKRFEADKQKWMKKKLEKRYYILYIDALHISVRREDHVEKEAFYIVMGLKEDFTREILGVYNTPTESSAAWREHFQDIKDRGLEEVQLIIADELPGIENVTQEMFKGVRHQSCVVHKKRNIIKDIRPSDKPQIQLDLKEVFKVGNPWYSKKEAKTKVIWFLEKWKKYPSLKRKLKKEKLDFYFAYLDFPYQIQSMIYTTNWIERLNKSIRKTTKNRNSMPSPESAITLVIATIIEKEKIRYLKYPINKFKEVEYELKRRFKGEKDAIYKEEDRILI